MKNNTFNCKWVKTCLFIGRSPGVQSLRSCPVRTFPYKGKLCSCSLLMWQHLSLRCCQKYTSSTESSAGRESFFFFQIQCPMPDFTFTVSLGVNPDRVQTWLKPLLTEQKKGATLFIFLWSGKSGNGEVQWVWVGFTWIKLDALLFSISLNSDQDRTPTLRCVAEFGIAGDGRDSCIQQPPTSMRTRKLNHPQRSCVLIILLFVITYGSFSFIWFISSAAFFEMSKGCSKFHITVLNNCLSSLAERDSQSYHNWDIQTQADVWSGVWVWTGTILKDNRNRRAGFPKVMTSSMSFCVFLCVPQLTSAGHDATWQRKRGSQQTSQCWQTALWAWSMMWHLQLVRRTWIRVLFLSPRTELTVIWPFDHTLPLVTHLNLSPVEEGYCYSCVNSEMLEPDEMQMRSNALSKEICHKFARVENYTSHMWSVQSCCGW